MKNISPPSDLTLWGEAPALRAAKTLKSFRKKENRPSLMNSDGKKLTIDAVSRREDKYTIELIVWIDSTGLSEGWEDINSVDVNRSMECWTVGYILMENETKLILAASVAVGKKGKPEQVDLGIIIPKSVIVKRVLLQ